MSEMYQKPKTIQSPRASAEKAAFTVATRSGGSSIPVAAS